MEPENSSLGCSTVSPATRQPQQDLRRTGKTPFPPLTHHRMSKFSHWDVPAVSVPVSPGSRVAQRGLHHPWARREPRRRQPRSGHAGHQARSAAPPAPPQLQRAGSGPACSGEGHGPLPDPAPGSRPRRSHKPGTRTLCALNCS